VWITKASASKPLMKRRVIHSFAFSDITSLVLRPFPDHDTRRTPQNGRR
jgi:hypothetical protein